MQKYTGNQQHERGKSCSKKRNKAWTKRCQLRKRKRFIECSLGIINSSAKLLSETSDLYFIMINQEILILVRKCNKSNSLMLSFILHKSFLYPSADILWLVMSRVEFAIISLTSGHIYTMVINNLLAFCSFSSHEIKYLVPTAAKVKINVAIGCNLKV